MCVCVRPIFYFSAIRRDIDLKFIQDPYRVVPNSLKNIDLHRARADPGFFNRGGGGEPNNLECRGRGTNK